MYPEGKNTKIFPYFVCSYLGEENIISDMLKSTEQKADVGLCLLVSLPNFCFHPLQLLVHLLEDTPCWCAAAGAGALSPLCFGSCCCLQEEKTFMGFRSLLLPQLH